MDLTTVRQLKDELRSEIDSAYRGQGGIRFGGSVKFGAKKPRFSLGVAPAPQPGQFRLAVRAESESELPPAMLEKLRRAAAGEVDILFTGPVEVKPADAGRVTPYLAVGASVGHYRCKAGSIGFFARRVTDGLYGLVSNNHVIAIADEGRDRDEVLHPAPADQGRQPQNVVALLAGDYPRLRGKVATVDCAFAVLVQGASFDPRPLGMANRLAPTWISPEQNLDVAKVGRSTGFTQGRVTAFDLDALPFNYGFGELLFARQIEIRPVSATPFSKPGDSGSLVFSIPQLHPMGLVFARSSKGITYANPIDAVLSALGVTLVT